jgi:hypothetical protein
VLLEWIRFAVELGVMAEVEDILLMQRLEHGAEHAFAGLDAVQAQEAGQRFFIRPRLLHDAFRQRNERRAELRAVLGHQRLGALVEQIQHRALGLDHLDRALRDEPMQRRFRLSCLDRIPQHLQHLEDSPPPGRALQVALLHVANAIALAAERPEQQQ